MKHIAGRPISDKEWEEANRMARQWIWRAFILGLLLGGVAIASFYTLFRWPK